MSTGLFDVFASGSSDRIAESLVLPAREARTAPLPKNLRIELIDALGAQGIRTLWSHQQASWDTVERGENLIVTTGTASGKSLCFNLPVLQQLLSDPAARALYLYPTKALAQDQIRHLKRLAGPGVRTAIYDGDTPADARRVARRDGRVVLTNPDMLSMGILPHHERWGDFFFNLRFVVIDEAHTYRGVFGSHVANVLRRLRRAAGFYGADPLFILTSATIRNAEEHGENLTGVPVTAISGDGAPYGRRTVLLWQPPLVDERLNLRRSPTVEAAEIFAQLVRCDVRSICFTKSRRAAELVSRFATDRLSEDHPDRARRISPYRAGYTPEQRRNIERLLFEGELLGVVSTNALELGIDVGHLDASVTVGYPGTVASLWQQWGRAGRSTGESLSILVAGNDALEQFFISHPRELLEREVEAATTGFTNPYIHGLHLAAAAYESPLTPDDMEYFGPGLPKAAAHEIEGRRLVERNGAWFVTGEGYPAADISLRSSSPDSFTIVEADTGDIIGTQEAETAFTFVHPGAVYLHLGENYLVEHLDLEGRIVAVRRFFGDYYTHPRKETSTEVLAQEKREDHGPLSFRLGTLAVSTQVVAYQKKKLGSDEALGMEELDLPVQHFVTEGLWFTMPLELIPAEEDLPRLTGGLHAIEHALIALLPLRAMCDRWDLGGLSTGYHHQTERPTIFVYDAHPGGTGISRQGFHAFAEWLGDALELIRECPCAEGCPSCIQSPKCGNWNEPLDKELAIHLLSLAAGR